MREIYYILKMEFEQRKRIPKNEDKYNLDNLKKAREFSKRFLEEMDDLVRSIVLFGSNSSKISKKSSDIDVMVVLDNVSVYVSDELREAYRIITEKITSDISDNFHIMTVNLSDLWDMARKGDPVLINILRTGMPLFDRDLIEPMQYLLEIGKIRPTREAIINYAHRSHTLRSESEYHIHEAFLDIYYSIVDSLHAALMCEGVTPPSPSEMPRLFKRTFSKNGDLLEFESLIKESYKVAKDIEHKRNLNKLTGSYYDDFNKRAAEFVKRVNNYTSEKLKNSDMFDL